MKPTSFKLVGFFVCAQYFSRRLTGGQREKMVEPSDCCVFPGES